MVIEFDGAKDVLNRKNHKGLSLALAAEFTAEALVVPTYSGSDTVRYKMIERTAHGLLTAIVTPRGSAVRVISLRRANRQEERMYGEEIQ